MLLQRKLSKYEEFKASRKVFPTVNRSSKTKAQIIIRKEKSILLCDTINCVWYIYFEKQDALNE